MNRFVIFFAFSVLIISTKAQDYSIEKHLEQGKQAFRKFADIENHKKLKQEREIKAYNIGDTKKIWRWNLSVMPPTWIQENATCRAVGENSYVFISNTEWNVNINQDDVDLIMFRLEEETLNSSEMGIIEMDTTYFGQIPDELDNDPKVIFFFSALGSYGGSTFDGYFSSYNQMTEAEAVAADGHSNECEMLYMSCNPVNPSAISTLSVLAHELQHLIHFGYDPNEETWVDEGCAELAMVLFGQPDPIVNFPSEPEDNLIIWDQQFLDYVQVMLFFTYLSEQYGNEIIKNIVHEQAVGVNGINNILTANAIPETFEAILINWSLANYIDNTSFGSGIYGYNSFDDLPDFATITHNNLPVSTEYNLNNCANMYFEFPVNFEKLNLSLNVDNTNIWDINLMTFDESLIIQEIIPSTNLEIIFNQPTSYTLHKIVAAVTNIETADNARSFVLNAEDTPGSVSNNTNHKINFTLSPNPLSDKTIISFTLPKIMQTSVVLLDFNGKIIANIFSGNLNKGVNQINWFSGNAAKGIYFIYIKTENFVICKKCIIL